MSETKSVAVRSPEAVKKGQKALRTTVSTSEYSHVYLGASKIYFLQEVHRTKRGRIEFNVVDHRIIKQDNRPRGTAIRLKKWQSDPHLHTAEQWNRSSGEVFRLGRLRLLKQSYTDPESRAHIPPLKPFHFKKDMIQSIMEDIFLDQNVCFTGRPGVGKTETIQQLAARLGIPCVRIQTSSGVTPESFVGGYVPGPGGHIVWADGLLTKAARYGWWAILDEWDFAPSSIRTLANPVLEVANRQLVLTDKDGGEILSRHDGSIHPNFRVFSTGNTMGSMADEADMFGGYADPNAAQLSRWNVYHIDFLSSTELLRVIKGAVPELTQKKARQIVKGADSINEAKIQGAWFSTRVALAVARKMKFGLDFFKALEPTFLNHHDQSTRRRIMQSLTDTGEV
jgi:MoxR-like ATPase